MSTVQDNCASTQPQLNASTVEYRDIPGYPGYRISSDGKVISAWKQKPISNKGGSVIYISDLWRYKACNVSKDGYVRVALKGADGKRVHDLCHRLVLLAWKGPCPEGMEACHNNGIRSDNRAENLRWDTPKNNQADRKKHGTYMPPPGGWRKSAQERM